MATKGGWIGAIENSTIPTSTYVLSQSQRTLNTNTKITCTKMEYANPMSVWKTHKKERKQKHQRPTRKQPRFNCWKCWTECACRKVRWAWQTVQWELTDRNSSTLSDCSTGALGPSDGSIWTIRCEHSRMNKLVVLPRVSMTQKTQNWVRGLQIWWNLDQGTFKICENCSNNNFPKRSSFHNEFETGTQTLVMRQNLGNLLIWVARAMRWVEITLDVLQHVLAIRIPKKSDPKRTQEPRIKITQK